MKPSVLTRPVWGWALYDFAHSAYTTSILTVLFSVYFTQKLIPPQGWEFFGFSIKGVSLWGYLNSLVMATVIAFAPLLGAWADKNNKKAESLRLWALIGAGMTMLFYFALPGRVGFAALIFFIATVAYEFSLVFYNAFIRDISTEKTDGFVSGFGYALGYIGGGLCLALNMAMVAKPEWFHIPHEDPTQPARLSFFVVGVWWALFSIPVFSWLKNPQPIFHAPIFKHGLHPFRDLKQTWTDLGKNPDAKKFMLAFVLYNDGIQTILLMAAVFGAEALGMTAVELGFCYLLIQFVAFIGALVFGRLADYWSHKKVILLTLIIYVAVAIYGSIMKTPVEFWILGVVIGLILGGSQSASRSFFSNLIPVEKSGAFFSLYSVVGKASALMGPIIFGVINQTVGIRAAVFSLVIFFISGGCFLLMVKEKTILD